MDEQTLKEYAMELKKYCSQHKAKCNGCIFFRQLSIGNAVYDAECMLREHDPENWGI